MFYKRLVGVLLACACALASLPLSVAAAKSDVATAGAAVSLRDVSETSYAAYMSHYADVQLAVKDVTVSIDQTVSEKPLVFEAVVEADGLYKIGMCYKPLDISTANIAVSLRVDGRLPYTEAEEYEFPRMWQDDDREHTDSAGNEFAPEQIPYEAYRYNETANNTVTAGDYFLIYLAKGVHQVTLQPISGTFQLQYFRFAASASAPAYQRPADADAYYEGEPIVLEGEDARLKSSYFLVGQHDTSSVHITPHSYENNKINYVGGGNWKSVGDTIIWTTPEMKAGYYKLGFSFRQNAVIGGKTYRRLLIDGQSPFAEAEMVGFGYDDNWQKQIFSDEKGNPYLIYLSEGVHEISLTVTAGEIGQVTSLLTEAVSMMGDLYVDITVITGETVDIYRDYELFSQIADMEERLIHIRELLQTSSENLMRITGQTSGSNNAVLLNMIEVIEQMLNNKFEAHRYKSYYYTNYCSVSSVLQDLRNMPLDLDKLVLANPEETTVFEKVSFFEQLQFSVMRFLTSFTRDYNLVGGGENDDGVTIWVNWGRDQAQVLSALIERSFTPNTGIPVNVQLVNASIVQATLSGNGPDCILQHPRSEPVNLAMRGVLYDLSQFEDYEEVLTRFQKGADIPYRYKGGLYALPDTQTFYMMFYRRDILDEFGIDVPKTWDDFNEAAKILTRHNMSVWLQNNAATDATQVNAGVGSNNIFPSLLLQNGLSLYTKDGKSTSLLSSSVMEIFEDWTDYYTKMKFPVSLSFYNRFRTGTTPLGIISYNFYSTIKVAAPEIDNLWDMVPIPGTRKEDGSISHASSGGGTGCAILQHSENPKQAWEVLKWWTSADTQMTYSNNIESILGPSGRISLSNVEAIQSLAWDNDMLDNLLSAWSQVEEIPEYPGSYYVSRSIYQSFWNVVNDNQNTKDMLMKYGNEADQEIARKWEQYNNRGTQ